MPHSHPLTLCDRLGNRLRARLLDNGHIQLCQHLHHYTYARLNRAGEIELYDGEGNISIALPDYVGAGNDEDMLDSVALAS